MKPVLEMKLPLVSNIGSNMKLTFKEINEQLKKVFGEEDNSNCIECIKCHCCGCCSFNEDCYVSGFDWMMCPNYEVKKDGIIIHDDEYDF